MTLKVLGISSSPRKNGNSDRLLQEALEGAASAGAETEYLSLRGIEMSPCVACNACFKTGRCRIQDEYQELYDKLLEVDRLVFATPIFFMSVSAQGKIFIDRAQCLWARKFVLGEEFFPGEERDRRGLVLAVGATRGTRMFECVYFMMKHYMHVLEMDYYANLWVNGVDEKGAILGHPDALDQARRLGRELISGQRRSGKRPRSTELLYGKRD